MAKVFREAEAAAAPKVAEPEAASAPANDVFDDWRDDFDAAPHDAQVVLTPDGERRVDAMWRKTRHYDNEIRGWVDSGYWADPIMRRKLPFEPLGWMLAPGQPKAPSAVA